MSRHVLVTGAGTGIGEAVSRQLHTDGYRVSLVGRRPEPLAALSACLGENAYAITGDVTDRGSISSAFTSARERFGSIEILVNSAGMAPTAPFHRVDFADWQRTMDVNVNGVFHCSQIALEDMLGAGWGRIINIASVASLRGFPYVSGYCASKHAVLGMTRALALEVATQGVTVNAICPGYVDTDIVRAAISEIAAKTGRTEEDAMRHFTESNPQGRLVEASEVASAVSWLCSDGAASVTGQAVAIDGGGTA
ncbi:MAG: SDR family oxidoreductase [Luminiphilus sp.]|nr:SDR family oxidoreductase [Luminiphilus sp.]